MWLGQYKLEFGLILQTRGDQILDGLFVTLWVSAAILALSLVVGLVASLGRISKSRIPYMASTIYVEAMRNTPELVILFFLFYGLPQIGVRLDGYVIGITALALHTGGYVTEIFRAGIQSVSIEQYWSGLTLGLTRQQTLRNIIIPQIKGDILPALTNQFIYTIKDTPLLSFIFIHELMYQAYDIQTDTWKIIEIYAIIGVIYLSISMLLGWVSRSLEQHYNRWRGVDE